jgi:fucose 4-O-acetylase-like acetyltransferase
MDSSAVSNPLTNIGRVHYLDQVRALALMMGILIHACYTYAYIIQDLWILTDQTSSMAITVSFLFFHLFRMPVFYMIAGFFANYIYQKRGVKGFLKHSLKRIGLPFIISLPLMLIGLSILMVIITFYVPEERMSPAAIQVSRVIKAQVESGRARKSGASNDTI